MFDVSEADEAATSKARALENFRDQVRKGETMGVVDLYERAARVAGASEAEISAARFYAAQARKAGAS